MTELEERLARYLADEDRGERTKRIEWKVDAMSATLQTVANQAATLTAETKAHDREDVLRFAEIGRRLDDLKGDVEDTGQHHIVELKAKVAKAEAADADRAGDRRKLRHAIIAGIIIAAITGIAGMAVGHVVTRAAPPAKSITK